MAGEAHQLAIATALEVGRVRERAAAILERLPDSEEGRLLIETLSEAIRRLERLGHAGRLGR